MEQIEDWRLVTQWLVKMRVLPQQSADVFKSAGDLSSALYDGVCLCRLLMILNPNSLTVSDYNLYPHKSEVSSLSVVCKLYWMVCLQISTSSTVSTASTRGLPNTTLISNFETD